MNGVYCIISPLSCHGRGSALLSSSESATFAMLHTFPCLQPHPQSTCFLLFLQVSAYSSFARGAFSDLPDSLHLALFSQTPLRFLEPFSQLSIFFFHLMPGGCRFCGRKFCSLSYALPSTLLGRQ